MNKHRVLPLLLLGGSAFAQSIVLPSTLTVNAISSTGASFTYSGTLTQAASVALNASGTSCEQGGGTYCTNASGVVVIPGSSPAGAATSFSGTFGGTVGTWNYGALIMIISGVGAVQVFPANTANGLGSGSPSSTVSLAATTLAALGFGSFSVVNPTITFVVADNNYGDNSGGFVLNQGTTPLATPAPATLGLTVLGVGTLALFAMRRRGFAV